MKDYSISVEELLSIISEKQLPVDQDKIKKALIFAQEAHKDQKRKSGEDYFYHPLSVCYILAEMNADEDTLIAGLLHDVIEDTQYSKSQIADLFGEEVSLLVDGVTKLHKYTYPAEQKRKDDQADNYRKLLLAICTDIRVLLIKLADRLHNMHTLQFKDSESQKRIAKETLDIYAPLANRFGLIKIQYELEDLSLKFLHYEEYKKIAAFLNETKTDRENYINKLLPDLRNIFIENEIPAEIFGRAKHLYSIYRKNLIRRVPYSEIYDFAGIRILVDTPDQCYFALALVHTLFEPTDKKLKDYINRPKANGYQSLHTVVIGPDNRKIEFQIRTHEMHLFAEEGIAAHWRYKSETYDKSKIHITSNYDNLNWIKDLLNKNIAESDEFIGLLKSKLEAPYIITVSPQNDYIKLPRNSCPLDFAFAIHSEVGYRCIGAKINDRMLPLKTILHDGDKVEIITSTQANPGKDWLKILKSSHARQKLSNFLRKKEREDAILIGKEIFEKRCRKLHWKYKTDGDIKELLKAVKINDRITLFYYLGTGKLLFSQIREAIQAKQEAALPEKRDLNLPVQSGSIGIRIGEVNNLMLNYAACCHPNPGDSVIGYITRGRGISIHRSDCQNPSFKSQCETEPERVVNVQWDTENDIQTQKYSVTIKISGKFRARFIFDLIGIFARYQCRSIELSRHINGHHIEISYRLLLSHNEDYDKLLPKLFKIQGVEKIERTGN
jgi:GTP pyrophosphokinase